VTVRFRWSSRCSAVAATLWLLAILTCPVEAAAAGLGLTWVDNSGGQSGFSIERSTSAAGQFAEIATTGPGVTAYTDTTAADQTSFCYRVRAIGAQGFSAYSNVACNGGAAPSAFITDLYRFVLGRVPSPTELGSWTPFLAANCNQAGFRTVGDAFFDSQEYRTWDPQTLTGLVTALYGAWLGRAPEPAGLADWTGLFRQQRIDVAMNFIDSGEFQGLVPDRRDPALVTPVVTRFYTAILGRAPDPPGLQGWVDYIVTTLDLEGTATAFLTSPEFEARALTSRSFVEILYVAFLGREPDPGGWDGWDGVLRGDLLGVIEADFIPSGEFQARVPQMCGG
jgi:uncharacterized protein DUF4214